MPLLSYISLLPLIFSYNCAEQIDNGLTEQPRIQCGSETLSINFKTRDAFEGHVYVKGHYGVSQCRSDATLEPNANLSISYSSCDVIRQRSSNPKGILMTATVIISFHPMFITKIDRSYRIQCFYAESSKIVTQQLNVDVAKEQEKNILVVVGDETTDSQNQEVTKAHKLNDPTVEKKINYNVPLPDCQYKVLNEARSEEVAFATVGQLVYHEWSCDDHQQNSTSPFCVTVHSCNVKDETGKEVQLFDENGCAVDKYLINNLEYTNDLTGGQFSQVFKFADQPSVFFQCKIRLALKEDDGSCKRSSDQCPMTLRGKRSVDVAENDFDVISQTMTVLDINESAKTNKKASEIHFSSPVSDLCVSSTTASGIFVLISSLLLVSFVLSFFLCFRHRTLEVKLAP